MHTLLPPPTCCTFPFWQSLDTHGHTHFTPQSRDREEKGGGRLIKTLRAVLDLTGWVKHTKHRSLLMSTQTRTLTDVSIHLDCHTHTPPRDLTSSVSQLNYSSPSSRLSLFFFLSVSLTSVWETDSNKDTCLACCRSLAISPAPTQNQRLKKSERTYVPDALLNVLMWLNVPSKTTTLGGEISFVWFCVLVCPLKTDKDCLMVLLAQTMTAQLVELLNASLWTIRPEPTWLSA